MNYEDRFTERAKHVIDLAQDAASELYHDYIGSEHILLGLIREKEGTAGKSLIAHGLNEAKILKIITDQLGKGNADPTETKEPTPRTRRIIERAGTEAQRLGTEYVGTEHLLMAMLREHDSIGARIVAGLGVDPNKLYTELTGGSEPTDENGNTPKFPKPNAGAPFNIIGPFKMQSDGLGIFGGQGQPAGGPAFWQQSGKGKGDSKTPTLDRFSKDLTVMARDGKLDPVIGRETEVQRIIQILSRRTKNNPVLIGEPGVGKTAVVEGLAQKIIAEQVPDDLRGKRIVLLDLAAMVAGTKYRGEFEERLKDAMDEVLQSNGNVILFLDEMHTVIGAGSAEGTLDASNIIKPALSRGELQIIGATTIDEYRKHVEKDRALERRFQTVQVNEPTQEDSIQILEGLKEKYEAHHKLTITDDAIKAAVEMSARYITDRWLPDKAIDLIDEACSRVRMQQRTVPPDLQELRAKLDKVIADKDNAARNQDYELAKSLREQEVALSEEYQQKRILWENTEGSVRTAVVAEDVAEVVSSWSGVPVTTLSQDESQRLLDLESILHKRVISQHDAVHAVAKAIRRGRVGLKDPKRPIGSFLFLGPTGVGKTELCRALAEALFGDENAMIKVDMSEYMEKHTVSRLIGSPPGYVGYDEGGQLTEKVRRKPYSVVLFDEIEKAHDDVFNILLQIMEDGILTDGHGRKVDFKNAVIVMTSNVGAQSITDDKKTLGFTTITTGEKSYEEIKKNVTAELKRRFKPEFLNRIDDVIVFSQLNKENIRAIANNMIRDIAKRVEALGLILESNDDAVDLLAASGFDPIYGARPLRRAIQNAVEDGISEKLLEGEFKEGDTVQLVAINDKAELIKK